MLTLPWENKMTLGLIIIFFLTPQDSQEFTLSFLLNVEDYSVYVVQLICLSVLLHNQKLFCICLQIWNHEQPPLVDAVTTPFCCQKRNKKTSFFIKRSIHVFWIIFPFKVWKCVSSCDSICQYYWCFRVISHMKCTVHRQLCPELRAHEQKWPNSTHLWRVMYQLNSYYQDQQEC